MKFPTSIECLSNGSVLPQDMNNWRTLYELLHVHAAQRRIEELGLVGGQLVRRMLPRDAQFLPGIHEHLHSLHYVLVDHVLVLAHQFRLKANPVDDSHLLQERRLARLPSTQQQQFHLEDNFKSIVKIN